MKANFILTGVCGLFLAALPAAAHHSFAAEYDGSKPLSLKGKVTQVEWVNPHSWIHIDVTGEDGKAVSWSCETAPPNGLYRQGWRRDTLKTGDEVVIQGFLAKDGSHTMTARTVQTADGKKLFAGSATDGAPQSQKPDEK
ncbi:MAG: hypothetical protein JO323_22065 [Acidobacteriia bacterium]|nr:hypothetical protein [Terriglobia bacterium]